MSYIKLSRQEKQIEDALAKGEYVPVGETKFKEIAEAITRRKNTRARLFLSKKRSVRSPGAAEKLCSSEAAGMVIYAASS